MERRYIKSSNLRTVGYEAETRLLDIEFGSRSVYRYFEVPEQVYRELLEAESAGRYFAQHIRDGYEFRRLR